MTAEHSQAKDQARRAAEGGWTDRFLERFADRIGGRATVQAVFGEPIQRGELTVVPVARVRWGFGGGAGSGGGASNGDEAIDGPATGSGSGGGGGVAVDPIGYLELRNGGAVFQPIVQPRPSPLFLLASGMTAAIVLRALARLIRR